MIPNQKYKNKLNIWGIYMYRDVIIKQHLSFGWRMRMKDGIEKIRTYLHFVLIVMLKQLISHQERMTRDE